ncbi:retrovirus-related pol polyprotein from transposon TNT 1-94 [Tanacetum coccineum]
MASEHDCLEPDLQRFNNPNSSDDLMNTPSKEDLDNLFGPMFEDYFEQKSSDTTINSAAQPTHDQEDLPSTSSIIVDTHEAPPVVTTSDEQTSPISLQESDEVNQEDSADFDGNTQFVPYDSLNHEEIKSSTTNLEPSNVQNFHQVQPSTHIWTKDHPLDQVIGDPSKPVMTRQRLHTDSEVCMYALTVSTFEPKNIKEAMADHSWIESMQDELNQFERLQVWELVPRPEGKNVIALKWLWENSAKRQKTSEYEAYVSGESSSGQVNVEEPGPSTSGNQEQDDEFDFWTDSYASDNDEIPAKQVTQDIMEEISLTIDEAKLKKMADEMLRQRCTSGDEHQYHIDQMKNFLQSDIVNKCIKKFNPYAKYGVENLKNPHAKIFHIRRQKEPGRPKEKIYSNSKIVQVIKTYWELGHEHKFIIKIVARRANDCIVLITEPDYKNLNKNDIEDMYLLILNNKKINLTTPTITFPRIEEYDVFSIVYEPIHGIIYTNSKKEKRVMRPSEIQKFYDATLRRTLEGLKSYYNDVKYGYVQKELTNDEVEFLKLFEEEIKVRLNYRDQMRRWEIKRVSEVEPKKVRENNDAPIIEDWVSDDEEQDESMTKPEKKTVTPTAAKIEKPVRKSVRYAEMYRSQRPRGNQRNWNGQKSNQLGSKFVMYNKACFNCGSFNHVQRNCTYHQKKKVVSGNNYNRVDNYYYAKTSHHRTHKNVTPRAVLLRTGLKPLSTAKPRIVNTARSYRTPVNTVRPRVINTARQNRTSVNAARANGFNAILVDLPNGKKAIGTKWVFRNKKDERGIVIRNKARLVAQGHRQEEGRSLCASTLRILKSDHPNKFTGLVKGTLYGLHQAPRASFTKWSILNTLDSLGKFDGKTDEGFFVGYSLSSKAFRVQSLISLQQDEDGLNNENAEQERFSVDSSSKDVNAVGQQVNTASLDLNTGGLELNVVGPSVSTASPNEEGNIGEEPEENFANSNFNKFGYWWISLMERRPLEQNGSLETRKMKGIVIRNKARLVAQGHRQEEAMGLTVASYGSDIFIKKEKGRYFACIVYVDDIIFGSTNKELCTGFAKCKKQTVVATSTTEAEYVAAASCCGQVETPRYLSLVVPLTKVDDEVVHKELGDRMERAATTASSLEVEQDSVEWSQVQDTFIGDVDMLTRFEITSIQSIDPPLSRGYTLEVRRTSSIRRDLHLDDAEGTDCLPTATIFEELARMGELLLSGNVNAVKRTWAPKLQLFSNSYQLRHYLRGGISQEVGTPRYLSLVVPLTKVGDEVIHKELGDIMERAATTASSLEAEQDSGSGPRCQDTILGDVNAQTRFEITSIQSIDPPLSRGYTLGSGEDSMKLIGIDEIFPKLAETHNVVAFLEKPKESDGFAEIIDFLKASSVSYALTVNPVFYTSCIEQFWATAKVQTVNEVRQIQALVDKKRVVVTESSIRRDLHLDDAEGTDCLPTATIFEELARMGYEKPSQKLTFYKAFFSPQWKYFVHTITQCLTAKSTAWNEFSSSMASLIICLATNQKFNLSKYIFDAMVKHLDGGVKFLVYPRFLQVFINQQLGNMSTHKKIFVNPFHTKKVFENIKRVGKDFSGRITPLFDTMMVQPIEEIGEDSDNLTDSTPIPIIDQPSSSSQPKKDKPSKKGEKSNLILRK